MSHLGMTGQEYSQYKFELEHGDQKAAQLKAEAERRKQNADTGS